MTYETAIVTAASDAAPRAKHDRHRVVLNSIGHATPANAASVAMGLSVPVPRVLEAFYRTPSVLVDGLTEDLAVAMVGLLRDLGCDARAEIETLPPPAKAALVDVSVHIAEIDDYEQIVSELAAFLGATEDEAARLLATPPGVVLGSVSPATVEALRDRLGDGVSLIESRPETALYDVFLGQCEPSIANRVQADLIRQGHEPIAKTGCLLTGIDKAEADRLWLAHHRVAALRVINRDFLRFDIVLTGTATGQPPDPAMLARLVDIAGIPPDIAPRLFAHCPITAMEAVPAGALDHAMTALGDAGFTLRADMTTFLYLEPEIIASPRSARVGDVLARLGLLNGPGETLPRCPFRLGVRLPDLQARLLKSALEAQGAEVALHDSTEFEGTS